MEECVRRGNDPFFLSSLLRLLIFNGKRRKETSTRTSGNLSERVVVCAFFLSKFLQPENHRLDPSQNGTKGARWLEARRDGL